MNTYGLAQVIKLWEVEQLTAEQTIGQILLLIREDRERMNEIERQVNELARWRVSELASRRGSESASQRVDESASGGGA